MDSRFDKQIQEVSKRLYLNGMAVGAKAICKSVVNMMEAYNPNMSKEELEELFFKVKNFCEKGASEEKK